MSSEVVKLLEGILVLLTKEQVDGLAVVLIVRMNHMLLISSGTI